MDASNSTSGVDNPKTSPHHHPLIFHGDGFEYFKIWVVNILLTIVTLGIYSAWAKVRNKRYFYGNLELDGDRFAYLASPLAILKGRLIAVAAFILFAVLSNVHLTAYLILGVVFIFAIPYLVMRSLMFNNRMSAYRNIQCRFSSNYGQAFMVVLVWPLLGVLTLGILLPKAWLEMNRFIVNNSAYGTSSFRFSATFNDYGLIFLSVIGISFVGLVLVSLVSYLLPSPMTLVTPLIMVVAYAFATLYFMVTTMNLFYRSTSLPGIQLNAEIGLFDYAKVHLINALLIILTLGLYLPAAKVRLMKYVCSQLTVVSEDALESVVAAEKENVSALGEEFGEVFDIEVGGI